MKTEMYLALLLLFCGFHINSQTVINIPYDFPTKPGTEAWKNLKTGQEMVDACQIPIEVLQQLSTSALAETCLNYPLALDYSAYNDERVGIKHAINNFNGLQELSRRTDGASALMNIYKNMPVNTKQAQISIKTKDNASVLHISYLELLLSNNVFRDKLSTKECISLSKIVQNKYEEKLKENDVYSLYSIKKTLLLGALILEKAKGNTISASLKTKIVEFANNFENPDILLLQDISKYINE